MRDYTEESRLLYDRDDEIIWYTHNDTEEIQQLLVYVDQQLLNDIRLLQDELEKIPRLQLHSARKRYDGYFVSGLPRGMIKMANLNYIFDLSVDIKTFGDICGGPGGFVKFLLESCNDVVGYGVTLNNTPDKYNIHSKNFIPVYGPNNDGDILNADFCGIFPKGLDLVMADGGLDVSGNENIQELLHGELYTAQVLLGLASVKVGGTFVMKFFDVTLSLSVCLLYLLAKSFERICIYKPKSSRAANSERYVICKIKNNVDIEQFKLCNFANMKMTKEFSDYVLGRNNSIARLQLVGLRRLIWFSRRPALQRNPIFIKQWKLDKFLPHKNVCRKRNTTQITSFDKNDVSRTRNIHQDTTNEGTRRDKLRKGYRSLFFK